MNSKNYFLNWLNKLNKTYSHQDFSDLQKISKLIMRKNRYIYVFGNGGSSSIANHFGSDLIKQLNLKNINFSNDNLLTCFANDFGWDNWISNCIKRFVKKDDLIFLISSSGNSKNMINAAKEAKSKNAIIVTLTGFSGKNKLSKMGNINLIANSKNYNIIENTHQIWLLLLIDYCGKIKIN